MRRFLAWLFRKPLVWLIDFDGEVNLRFAHCWTEETISVNRVGWDIRTVFLLPDGKIKQLPKCYVDSWKPANKKAEELFKPNKE